MATNDSARQGFAESVTLVMLVTFSAMIAISAFLLYYIFSPVNNPKNNPGVRFYGLNPEVTLNWSVLQNQRGVGESGKTIQDESIEFEVADWGAKIGTLLQGTIGVAATIASALVAVFLASVAIKLAKTTQQISEGEKRREDHRYAREIKLEVNKYIAEFEKTLNQLSIGFDTKKFSNIYSAYLLASGFQADQVANQDNAHRVISRSGNICNSLILNCFNAFPDKISPSFRPD